MKLQGLIAIVTGAASGIGEACCRHLLDRGAAGVGALDMNEDRGAELRDELGDKFLFARTDVADVGAVDAAVRATHERFGAVHAVINSAGITLPAKLLGRKGPIAMEKFDTIMKVNLYGTLHAIRAAVPLMAGNAPNEDGERGVIVNFSSGAAYEGQVGQIGYSASKAAVIGMTMPLMRELAEYGIRVTAIAPGGVDTPIYETVPPEVKESLLKYALFPKRFGKPSECALFVEEIIRNPMHNGRAYRFDSGMILPPGI